MAEMTKTKPAAHDDVDPTMVAVHNRLFFRLFQIGNILQRQSAKQLGVTTVQWAVLGALARPRSRHGMTVTELAEYLVVSRQNLDGVLTRLERENHVSRVADSIDKRSRRVRMTEVGWRFWNDLQSQIAEFYRQALVGFRFDDKVACVHFLNRLQTNLRAVELG
jgi:DNA-binding MarR family transcriptional regulator